jgi:hypothetical protein
MGVFDVSIHDDDLPFDAIHCRISSAVRSCGEPLSGSSRAAAPLMMTLRSPNLPISLVTKFISFSLLRGSNRMILGDRSE